jgi:hypothetical protein
LENKRVFSVFTFASTEGQPAKNLFNGQFQLNPIEDCQVSSPFKQFHSLTGKHG